MAGLALFGSKNPVPLDPGKEIRVLEQAIYSTLSYITHAHLLCYRFPARFNTHRPGKSSNHVGRRPGGIRDHPAPCFDAAKCHCDGLQQRWRAGNAS